MPTFGCPYAFPTLKCPAGGNQGQAVQINGWMNLAGVHRDAHMWKPETIPERGVEFRGSTLHSVLEGTQG